MSPQNSVLRLQLHQQADKFPLVQEMRDPLAKTGHLLLQGGGESPSPASKAPGQGEDCAKLLTFKRAVDLSTYRRERGPVSDGAGYSCAVRVFTTQTQRGEALAVEHANVSLKRATLCGDWCCYCPHNKFFV
jgi:hypothetical protein